MLVTITLYAYYYYYFFANTAITLDPNSVSQHFSTFLCRPSVINMTWHSSDVREANVTTRLVELLIDRLMTLLQTVHAHLSTRPEYRAVEDIFLFYI